MSAVVTRLTTKAQIASLRRDYPGWRIFRSDEGRVWAQRQRPRTWIRPWMFDCYDTDTPAQMRARLARQHAGTEDP